MKRKCAASGLEFEISDLELEFYRKYAVEPPKLCPAERQRRRIAHRNFRSLYQRTCDATGRRLISMYSPESPFPVYDNSYWWSDGWDARDFGRPFDFNRPFFEQYAELSRSVPRHHIMNVSSENCEYSNMVNFSRDCYLVFGCVNNDSCMYGHIVWNSEGCFDNLYIFRCKYCSNSIDIVDCYDVHYSAESSNCSESYFLYDCRGCSNCFGGAGLRNKQYCFFNEQLSKDEYRARLSALLPLNRSAVALFRGKIEELKRNTLHPAFFGSKNEDVSGNHVYECKNVHFSFDVKCSEDVRYSYTAGDSKSAFDLSFTRYTENAIECLTCPGTNEIIFSHLVHNSSNIAYSEFCAASHDLFGCNGIRSAEYCILNKQYSKDDYHALREKVIAHMRGTGEWGEFFPMALSPFAYNESIASEYYPLSESECMERGLRWKQADARKARDLNPAPESVDEAMDRQHEAFTCSKIGKEFKFLRQELEFYKRSGVALPDLCPDERHLARMAERPGRTLTLRSCADCGARLLTAYDNEPRVACDSCYLASL